MNLNAQIAAPRVPAYRLEPAIRNSFKPLARKILRTLMHVTTVDQQSALSALQEECRAAGYIWGDLFLQVIDLGWRYESAQDAKAAARVKELRADLRAFVNDDAALDDEDLLEKGA